MFSQICKGPIPSLDKTKWSPAYVAFVARCLQRDVSKRPSARELAEDPFLKESITRIRQDGCSYRIARLCSEIHSELKPATANQPVISSIAYHTPTQFDWMHRPIVSTPNPPKPPKTTLVISKVSDMSLKRVNVDSIVANPGMCNDEKVTQWDMSFYRKLKSLYVGDCCFKYVMDFCMSGFAVLESITVEKKSFSCCDGMPSTSRHARFAVSDCPRLQTLRIGDDSFADFSQFSLKRSGKGVDSR